MPHKVTLSSPERAVKSAALALDKKALNLKILDIRPLSTIADYLVLATGTSDKHVQAIADSVRIGLKKYGKNVDIEGEKAGKWIVIDYKDVIVHIFLEDTRSHYNLDELWGEAEIMDIPEEYLWETKPQ
ncbi:MAG: ribosome silencing factor [Desulfuromonadales bacterium]|nr:ribosome silencing factor [Desulfuromonadales bacterium]